MRLSMMDDYFITLFVFHLQTTTTLFSLLRKFDNKIYIKLYPLVGLSQRYALSTPC